MMRSGNNSDWREVKMRAEFDSALVQTRKVRGLVGV